MNKTLVTYSRKPTASEIRFGYGARHYKDFSIDDVVTERRADGSPSKLKKRLKCKDDGLIYTR